MVELPERAPDGLMDAEGVRVLDERGKEQLERVPRLAAGRQVARERQTRPPVLRILLDQAPAERREALRVPGPHGQRFERSKARYARSGARSISFSQMAAASRSLFCASAHVAEIEVGGHGPAVEVDRGFEAADGLSVVLAAHRLAPDLVLEEGENGLALRPGLACRRSSTAAAACRRPRSTDAAPRGASAG